MTRRGYVALALAVVVLLVVPLGLVPFVLAHERDAEPPASVDDDYRIDGDLTCDSDVPDAPTLPLEEQPVALLVCADPDSSMPWTAPTDVLEQGLDRLTRQLAELEPAPDEPFDCTFDAGPDYVMLFRFADDRVMRLDGSTAGCRLVSASGADWFGGDEVMSTVVDLVHEQRATRTPPTDLPKAPPCTLADGELPAYSLTGDVRELVVATSCWTEGTRPNPQVNGPVEVDPRDVRTLVRDLAANSEPVKVFGEDLVCPGGRKGYYSQWLLGRTAWGDLIPLHGSCHEFAIVPQWQRPERGDPMRWMPSPRAQQILDRLRR